MTVKIETMKKLFLIILTIVLLAANALASGTVTQSAARVDTHIRTITFVCVGDSSNGSIPNTDTNSANTEFIKGFYLYKIEAYPTTGGTAPDAADVLVYDSGGMDLLGSEDGSTAYAGLNLIHATLKKACMPNLFLTGRSTHVNYYPEIRTALTLDVDNQGTNSAEYTIVLTFVK